MEGGRGRGFSDGSCVCSSVFLKKNKAKQKTLHVCAPTGSVAKRCSRNPIGSQDQLQEVGRVFTALPEVRGGGGAGGRKWADEGGGLYWTVVTASWMDWAT